MFPVPTRPRSEWPVALCPPIARGYSFIIFYSLVPIHRATGARERSALCSGSGSLLEGAFPQPLVADILRESVLFRSRVYFKAALAATVRLFRRDYTSSNGISDSSASPVQHVYSVVESSPTSLRDCASLGSAVFSSVPSSIASSWEAVSRAWLRRPRALCLRRCKFARSASRNLSSRLMFVP